MIKALLSVLLLTAAAAAETGDARLNIYFIDVEGGQATLFLTPSGESLLIDTGWPGPNGRDADRIVAAAHRAGLSRINYVLITHFHEDHVGGVPQLAAKIPIGTFIDHGLNRELTPEVQALDAAYRKQISEGKSKHLVLTPGDRLPLAGVEVSVVSGDGNLITSALPRGGQTNRFCPAAAPPPDTTENARSLGILVRFHELTILDLGDLTRDKEYQLMCPANLIGPVDILIVSHHGWLQSSSPALIEAVHPRVAIMDNGASKGGSTPVLDRVRGVPGLEALWQLHYSDEGGEAHNTAAEYIANLPGPDAGNYVELAGDASGSFSVTNSRNGLTRTYPARRLR